MSSSKTNNSIANSKQQLRQQAKAWRNALTRHDVMEASRKVSEQLEQLDFSKIQSIHCYQAIEKNNEIDPDIFLSWLRTEYPDIEITLQTKSADLNNIATESQFDLILVPLLMSDDTNYRLGYGGGFYDQFLKTQTRAQTIGLGYKALHVESLPVESHDVPLSKILLA